MSALLVVTVAIAALGLALVIYKWFRSEIGTVATTRASSARIATASSIGRRRGAMFPAASAPEDEAPRSPDESERVLSYREQMFEQLGFNRWQSVALAESNADWHEAEKLIQGGCSFETALDLLL